MVKELKYNSFGQVIYDSAHDFDFPFRFAGGIWDEDTKLIRFGVRDYDPETGRWTSKEPLGFAGSRNWYVYSYNNPVNWYDLTGFKPGDPFKTADEAAIDALEWIMPISRLDDREYGGVIYKGDDGCFYATEPIVGEDGINNRDFNFPGELLKKSIASYHTHPNKSAKTFSKKDIYTNEKFHKDGYLMNDSGDILKHDISNEEVFWIDSDSGYIKDVNIDYEAHKSIYGWEIY